MPTPLSRQDRSLIRAADRLIRSRYAPRRHELASALRAGSGRVYTSVHVEPSVGNCALCAEWGAIAQALSAGESKFDAIVTVKHFPDIGRSYIVPPCGICRELLSDLTPIEVIVENGRGKPRRVPIRALLPRRYADRKAEIRHENGLPGRRRVRKSRRDSVLVRKDRH
jgi:cytidine deaminase